MKGGRAAQRTAGTEPWRCETAEFFSWVLAGGTRWSLEAMVREEAENTLGRQIIGIVYAKKTNSDFTL